MILKQPAVLAPAHTVRVSQPQGWISPAALCGRRIVGTWEHETQHDVTRVQVTPFAPVADEVCSQLAAEAERLDAFTARCCLPQRFW